MRRPSIAILAAGVVFLSVSCAHLTRDVSTDQAVKAQQGRDSFGDESKANADRMYDEGKRVFRDDTFDSEAFWVMKGGFYHDGRFADLNAVVDHYQTVLKFTLADQERRT